MNDYQRENRKAKNDSETFALELTELTMLRPWSFSNPHIPKVSSNAKSEELCDVIAVSGDNIILIAVAEPTADYARNDDPLVNWRRWYKKIIEHNFSQLKEAKRLILQGIQVYTEKNLTTEIELPSLESASFYCISINLGAEEACIESFGGRGSLGIYSALTGKEHTEGILRKQDGETIKAGPVPFIVGQHSSKLYVHTLDRVSALVLFNCLSTQPDLLGYLRWKEAEHSRGVRFLANDECQQLAYYLKHVEEQGNPPLSQNGKNGFLDITSAVGNEQVDNYFEAGRRKIQESLAWDATIDFIHQTVRDGHVSDRVRDTINLADTQEWLEIVSKEDRDTRVIFSKMASILAEYMPIGYPKVRTLNFASPSQEGLYYLFACFGQDPGEKLLEELTLITHRAFYKEFGPGSKVLGLAIAPGIEYHLPQATAYVEDRGIPRDFWIEAERVFDIYDEVKNFRKLH